jgi:shikimate kinase
VTIILLGMKHSGKSKLGRMLAGRLGLEFVDTDDRVEIAYHDRTGERASVRDVFGALGEEGFAELEAQVVERLAAEAPAAVIALGGRTPLNDRAKPHVKRLGPAVFLRVDPPALWDRVERKGIPPFLDSANPRADFLRLCRERTPVYEAMAQTIVDLDGLAPPGANLRRILSAVEELGNAR